MSLFKKKFSVVVLKMLAKIIPKSVPGVSRKCPGAQKSENFQKN